MMIVDQRMNENTAMHYEPAFPLAARPMLLLIVFLFCLATFHVLFLRIWQLGKFGWKAVDYVWLGVAVVGLAGAAFQARHLVAERLIVGQRTSTNEAYGRLRNLAVFFEKTACLKSPETDHLLDRHLQFQANLACKTAHDLYARLPPVLSINQKIQWLNPPSPFIANALTISTFELLDRAKNDYEISQESLREVEASVKRGRAEEVMALTSPLFIALALALRITKVTGEILLERCLGRAGRHEKRQ